MHTPHKMQCDVNGHALARKFTELSSKLDLSDSDVVLCSTKESNEGIILLDYNTLSKKYAKYHWLEF